MQLLSGSDVALRSCLHACHCAQPAGSKIYRVLAHAALLYSGDSADQRGRVADVAPVVEILSSLTCMEELILSDYVIDDAGAMTLWPHIAYLTGLKVLDLSENLIGDKSLEQFGPYLAHLLCLHTLNLSDQGEGNDFNPDEVVNDFTMAGALALVPTLCNLPCLKVLDVSENRLLEIGRKAAEVADPDVDLEGYVEEFWLELEERLPSVHCGPT